MVELGARSLHGVAGEMHILASLNDPGPQLKPAVYTCCRQPVPKARKTDWPKLDQFKFLILDIFSARRVSAELHLLDQSEAMWSSGTRTEP